MSLLIDMKIINYHKLSNIQQNLKNVPVTKKNLGVIFIVNEQQIEKLKSLKGGAARLNYFNSPKFIKYIKFYTYIVFDNKECILSENSIQYLEIVIENTMRYLPNNLKLVYPYSGNISILKKNYFKKISNQWVRHNDIHYDKPDKLKDNSIYTGYNKQICSIEIKLSEQALEYIKGLSYRGSSLNNKGIIKQKELAGEMFVSEITNKNIHIIEIKKLNSGYEERVTLNPSILSFHTHPIEAYEKHNFKNGWPSHTDYCSVLKQSKYNLVVHFVISAEGMYVISFSKEWLVHGMSYNNTINNLLENYKAVSKNTKKSPEWHVKEMNSFKYKGLKIFNNYFFSWNDVQGFNVYFKHPKNICKLA